MKILFIDTPTGKAVMIQCPCGFVTEAQYTVEAAGRKIDLHMAEKFPIGTQRRPCDAR
jgi:hypothetical protein